MIGKNIRRLRKNKKMTQEDFGKLVGLSTNTVQRYELGKRQPTIETINKIAEALGVSINELIDTNYISKCEYNTEEEIVKILRNLLKVVDKKDIFKDVNNFDIYMVINSEEFKNYLIYLFWKRKNSN